MQQEENRFIFHVDIDAFYVSVEMREDPKLRGLPVVVGADPNGGKARGVVVTCSYEARKFGLHSGMPISQAYRLCPKAVYMRPNWDLYEKTSEQVMGTLKEFADEFEQGSIDEAFLDVSKRVASTKEAELYALAVKKAILARHQLTCSIGIAPNKSAAKIASDRKKPDGLTLVPPGSVETFLASLPVSAVPGIGKKTEEFLKERKIETIAQLQSIEGKQLVSWFGKNGVWLWGVIHGQEHIEVRQKSAKITECRTDLRTRCLGVRSGSNGSPRCCRGTHEKGEIGRTCVQGRGIKIRFQGFETHTREKSLASYTDSEEALRTIVESLMREFEHVERPVRLIGVRVADLRRTVSESARLDDWVD